MKVLEHHLKAQLIYKRIQQIKRDALTRLEKRGFFDEIVKEHQDLFRKEKLDYKTAFLLKNMLLRRTTDTSSDPIQRSALDTLLEEINAIKELEKKENPKIITLSIDGDLWREPKSKFCYRMRTKKPLAIFSTLKTTNTPTSVIREQAGIKNNEAVRKLIGKINARARDILKLKKAYPLIDSKGEGYRINPYYKLVKK